MHGRRKDGRSPVSVISSCVRTQRHRFGAALFLLHPRGTGNPHTTCEPKQNKPVLLLASLRYVSSHTVILQWRCHPRWATIGVGTTSQNAPNPSLSVWQKIYMERKMAPSETKVGEPALSWHLGQKNSMAWTGGGCHVKTRNTSVAVLPTLFLFARIKDAGFPKHKHPCQNQLSLFPVANVSNTNFDILFLLKKQAQTWVQSSLCICWTKMMPK